jgi:nucleoside-diphosphate-sugar epimerase
VDLLLARGATVRALVRRESPLSSRNPRVGYWTADLLDDRSVRESPVWDGVTHVFHVGGVTKRRTLAQFRDGNVVPTANLLSAVAARGVPIERFVLVSSQTAAGPATGPDTPVREGDPLRPVEAYGRSKGEAEDATRRYANTLPITIVRPGAVYGPRDVDFLKIFKQASGRLAVYAAPRDQAMSIVYVRDLVEAILLAADVPSAAGRTYFAADATPVTWRTLYAVIEQVAGSHPLEVQLPGPLLALAGHAGNLFSRITGRPVLLNNNKIALARPKWWLCDSTRIREELGWTARTSLLDGVRETYVSYCKAGDLRVRMEGRHAMTDTLEE